MAGTRHTRKSGRKRSCTLKRGILTRRAAERYRAWRIANGAAEWTVRVYECKRFCGLFHVGHRPDPKQIHRH